MGRALRAIGGVLRALQSRQHPEPNLPALMRSAKVLHESAVRSPFGSTVVPLLGSSETLGGLSLHSESLLEFSAFPRAICQPIQFQNSN